MKSKKILMLVLDGAGDRPISALNDMSPLEYARTPNLDTLAKIGVTGILDIIGNGRIPNSSSGALALLGYDVNNSYPGDSMLEAIGMDKDLISNGDLTVHTSFATGDSNTNIIDRRVCRDLSSEEAISLAADITDNVKLPFPDISFRLFNYRYYRNILVVKKLDGGRLSDNITNTDPAHKRDGYFDDPQELYQMKVASCVPLDETPDALFSSKIINEFIKRGSDYLSDHPINIRRKLSGKPEANLLITRNATSKYPIFPTYQKNIGMFVEMPGERAVGLLLDAKFIEHSYLATPSPEFYLELAKSVIQKVNQQDLDIIYVHTKGPDEPSHDGDFREKVRVIEMMDQFFIGSLIDTLTNNSELITVVTCDHATPCVLKVHSADPVPFIVNNNSKWESDKVLAFNERACEQGKLGRILAKDLLSLVYEN